MGFISAILENWFSVWCSYRCSRRSIVLLLEINWLFCKWRRLALWFVMKAAFGPGYSDAAIPPLLLAFRECIETSPEQWWAGASEWGTHPSLTWGTWLSSSDKDGALAGLLDRRAYLFAAGMGRWKNGQHMSPLEAWHLACCIPWIAWLKQLGPVMFKFAFCRSTYLKSLLIFISKEVTVYWGKAGAASLGYLYPVSGFGRNFLCYFGHSYSILHLIPCLEIFYCLQVRGDLLMWGIHTNGAVVWYYKGVRNREIKQFF